MRGGGSSAAGQLVLVVEDNDKNLKLVRDLLELHGFRVQAAASGEEAVALAAAERPAVALVDIQLPDMDGTEVLRRLRADPATAGVRVLAVTAYAMVGDAERFVDAGFDGHVPKPIDVRTFVDRVRAVLEDGRE